MEGFACERGLNFDLGKKKEPEFQTTSSEDDSGSGAGGIVGGGNNAGGGGGARARFKVSVEGQRR